jgi:hypothetical protein
MLLLLDNHVFTYNISDIFAGAIDVTGGNVRKILALNLVFRDTLEVL